MKKYFRRKVNHGYKTGRKIGFPTLNFHCRQFGEHHTPGVYGCEVAYKNKSYLGALHFGPSVHEKAKNILEVHVLDFNKSIYGEWVKFRLLKKIRSPKKMNGLDELKAQIHKDIAEIKKSANLIG